MGYPTAPRAPSLNEDEGHLATHYLVEYNIRRWSAGHYRQDDLHIDLLAITTTLHKPCCYGIEAGYPVRRTSCGARLYRRAVVQARGNMLLGHLLVHIAKLLNFDRCTWRRLHGWNARQSIMAHVLGSNRSLRTCLPPALRTANRILASTPAFARGDEPDRATTFQLRKPTRARPWQRSGQKKPGRLERAP